MKLDLPFGTTTRKLVGLLVLIDVVICVELYRLARNAGLDSNQTWSMVAVIGVTAGVGAVGIALLVHRWMSQISDFVRLTNKIVKEGDLTESIEGGGSGEIGQLRQALAAMVAWLREVPEVMREASRNLAAAAAEIHAAAQEQESSAQQQSAALEEVATTTARLLSSAGHISDSAGGVLENAERTRETSELTAKKIAELNGHTARISEILEVIRDIAERSDLLALNASLEGTRAGEAGRGFSLIAAEMRRLAERVTASVKDVKEMVSDIRSSSAGTVVVTEEVRKLAENTTSSAQQISHVTQQQKTATEQVAESMRHASSVLSQSVTAARQTRSAAEALKGQADALTDLVSQFRMDAGARA